MCLGAPAPVFIARFSLYPVKAMAKPEQEQLFSDIKTLSLRVDALKGFVQNDIDRLLEDGYTTRTEIVKSISEAEHFFEKCGKELESLKIRVVCLLSSYRED